MILRDYETLNVSVKKFSDINSYIERFSTEYKIKEILKFDDFYNEAEK